VIRKATVELTTPDVRAAFLKAANLVSAAQGEYVEASTISGRETSLRADLTLRVAASRLSDVLNALRELGEVRSEQTGGEDVTGQVVDIEARLRNEQRVEAELLELLQSRKDAPLDEILEVRSSLASVRRSVEQLTAQRDRLGHLVSLATVLVIIRRGDAPEPVQDSGLLGYFAESCHVAWQAGVRVLVWTVGGVITVVVGGLVWWVLLIIVLLLVRRRLHRRRAT